MAQTIELDDPESETGHLDLGPQRGARILVLSASVGKGHDAAGEAVVRHLTPHGHHVVLQDGLRPIGQRTARTLERSYAYFVSHHLRIWGAFHDLNRHWPLLHLARTATRLRAHRLLRLVHEYEPDIVVSTYPIVSIALSHLRKTGDLRVPLVVVIGDFWAHPICVAPDANAQLVPSRESTAHIRPAARNVRVSRVPTGFAASTGAADQAAARRILELPERSFISLIAGGSLGVGDLEGAAACAISQGAYPVIISGLNKERESRLRQRFSDPDVARVVGWTDDMPTFLRAADCFIQNAGGMMCLEALEIGVPLILYRPIPGQGRANATVMERTGAAIVAHNQRQLNETLGGAVRGTKPLKPPTGGPDVPFLDVINALLDDSGARASWVRNPELQNIGAC